MQPRTRSRLTIIAPLLAAAWFGLWPQAAAATTIDFLATPLGGDSWRYDYTVHNDTLAVGIEEFTIYFDATLYSDLAVGPSTPSGWDPLIVPPSTDPFDLDPPSDGFYDAYADPFAAPPAHPIAPGDSLGGFSIVFTFLGQGAPGSQYFEIVDPSEWALIDVGQTTLGAVIPLPAAFWLFATALAGLGVVARRRSAD